MHTKYQHGGDIYSNKVSIDYSANINPLGLPQGVNAADWLFYTTGQLFFYSLRQS